MYLKYVLFLVKGLIFPFSFVAIIEQEINSVNFLIGYSLIWCIILTINTARLL